MYNPLHILDHQLCDQFVHHELRRGRCPWLNEHQIITLQYGYAVNNEILVANFLGINLVHHDDHKLQFSFESPLSFFFSLINNNAILLFCNQSLFKCYNKLIQR